MTGNYHQSHLKLKDKRVQLITEKEAYSRIFQYKQSTVTKRFLTWVPIRIRFLEPKKVLFPEF